MAVCKYCNKKISTKDAYVEKKHAKTSTKVYSYYYCDKSEYYKYINRTSYRNQINDTLKYLIGCNISYNLFQKELGNEYKLNDGKNLCDYLVEQRDKLDILLQSKDFNTLYAKSKYLISVIKNNLANYISNTKQDITVNLTSVITDMETVNTNTYKNNNKRRSLAEIEDNL